MAMVFPTKIPLNVNIHNLTGTSLYGLKNPTDSLLFYTYQKETNKSNQL